MACFKVAAKLEQQDLEVECLLYKNVDVSESYRDAGKLGRHS